MSGRAHPKAIVWLLALAAICAAVFLPAAAATSTRVISLTIENKTFSPKAVNVHDGDVSRVGAVFAARRTRTRAIGPTAAARSSSTRFRTPESKAACGAGVWEGVWEGVREGAGEGACGGAPARAGAPSRTIVSTAVSPGSAASGAPPVWRR